MEKLLGLVLKFLPLIFAFGFLVPVILQAMQMLGQTLGWTPPFGLSVLSFALLVGGSWGVIAQVRGRWV